MRPEYFRNVLAPAHQHSQAFHAFGITHHFTPMQGALVGALFLFCLLVVLVGLARIFRGN